MASRLRQLARVFLVASVVVVVAGGASLVAGQTTVDELADRIDPLRTANRDLLGTILDADTELRGYRLTWDPSFLPAYRAARARYPADLRRAEEVAAGDEDVAAAVAEQDRLFQEWLAYADEVERLGAIDVEAAERLVRSGQGRERIDAIRAANDRASTLLDADDARIQARSRRITQLAGGTMVLAALGAAGAGWLSARRTREQVTAPLERLQGTIAALRAGDLGARTAEAGVVEVREVARAFNRLSARNQELTAIQEDRLAMERQLRDLGREMRSTLNPADVVRQAAEILGPVTRSDRVAIRSVSEATLGELSAEWVPGGRATAGPAATLEPPPALLAEVVDDLAAGRSVVIEDTYDHPRLGAGALALFTDGGWGSVVLVPVSRQGEVGALVVLEARERDHVWAPDEIRLAEAVAAEVGVALRTAELFDQERAMVARLQELDQTKSDFVSSVSHELRTPLTSIRGYVEMLRDGEAGEPTGAQDQMLAVVERNTDRLLSLIEDLLTLSRIESGSFKVSMVRLDVAAVVRGSLESLRPQAAAAGLELRAELADGLPPVRGDAHQVERVVLNLLSNAVKFTPAGGAITVRARPEAAGVRLDVSDTGLGIPPAEQERLFSRFFRSSTSLEHAIPGTGLGLVIVKSVVEGHGGTITLSSTPGEGTTFTVTLPADRTGVLAEALP